MLNNQVLIMAQKYKFIELSAGEGVKAGFFIYPY